MSDREQIDAAKDFCVDELEQRIEELTKALEENIKSAETFLKDGLDTEKHLFADTLVKFTSSLIESKQELKEKP